MRAEAIQHLNRTGEGGCNEANRREPVSHEMAEKPMYGGKAAPVGKASTFSHPGA